jgi:hypothetical protein
MLEASGCHTLADNVVKHNLSLPSSPRRDHCCELRCTSVVSEAHVIYQWLRAPPVFVRKRPHAGRRLSRSGNLCELR